jgi:hypothetical protein
MMTSLNSLVLSNLKTFHQINPVDVLENFSTKMKTQLTWERDYSPINTRRNNKKICGGNMATDKLADVYKKEKYDIVKNFTPWKHEKDDDQDDPWQSAHLWENEQVGAIRSIKPKHQQLLHRKIWTCCQWTCCQWWNAPDGMCSCCGEGAGWRDRNNKAFICKMCVGDNYLGNMGIIPKVMEKYIIEELTEDNENKLKYIVSEVMVGAGNHESHWRGFDVFFIFYVAKRMIPVVWWFYVGVQVGIKNGGGIPAASGCLPLIALRTLHCNVSLISLIASS